MHRTRSGSGPRRRGVEADEAPRRSFQTEARGARPGSAPRCASTKFGRGQPLSLSKSESEGLFVRHCNVAAVAVCVREISHAYCLCCSVTQCRVCARCRAERFIYCLVSGGVSHSTCAWLAPRASSPCSGMLAVPDLHDLHCEYLVAAVSGALPTSSSRWSTTLAASRSAALQSLGLVCLLSEETRNRPPGCSQRR